MKHFTSRRKGRVHVLLPPYAAGLVSNLAKQLIELLSDGEAVEGGGEDPLEAMVAFDGPREIPDDPALRRLLPDAHADDPEASAEFRRFTERALRDTKVADARVVVDTIGDIADGEEEDLEFELDRDQARSWMRCLTDLRLTLAERLDITSGDEDFWAGLPEGDDRLPVYEIYGWLGYLLESLLDAGGR